MKSIVLFTWSFCIVLALSLSANEAEAVMVAPTDRFVAIDSETFAKLEDALPRLIPLRQNAIRTRTVAGPSPHPVVIDRKNPQPNEPLYQAILVRFEDHCAPSGRSCLTAIFVDRIEKGGFWGLILLPPKMSAGDVGNCGYPTSCSWTLYFVDEGDRDESWRSRQSIEMTEWGPVVH